MKKLHTSAPLAAVLLLGATAVGCLTGQGVGESEFDEDPRKGLGKSPQVEISIERLGLEGHLTHDNAAVLGYHITNRGARRNVTLELHEWPPPEHVPWAYTLEANVAPLPLELEAGERRRDEWIIQSFAASPLWHEGEGSDVLLLVRDEAGRVLGATELPTTKLGARPVVVIAADTEVGLELQQAVHRVDIGGASQGRRRDVALVLSEPPTIWYEYEAASGVIMARPLAQIAPEARLALRRWTAFGGRLAILPEHCPDWRSAAPWSRAQPGGPPQRYGAGEIWVAPEGVPESAEERVSWLAGALPFTDWAPPSWEAAVPPLSLHYVMPDTGLLVALIVLIVVLVGPVAHLVLVRIRRREWAWIALPALSVVLAGCMFAAASGVKGEESALELHHLVRSFGDAPEAAVTTAIRVQSAEAGRRTLRATGSQPRAYFPFSPLGGPRSAPRRALVRRDGLSIEEIPMHRFSSQDFSATFPVAAPRIEIERLGADGIRVVNTSGKPLTDLRLWSTAGWHELGERLAPGERIERRSLGPGELISFYEDDWLEHPEKWWRSALMQAATGRIGQHPTDDVLLLAGCETEGLPRFVLEPEPQLVKETASCTWRRSLVPAGGTR